MYEKFDERYTIDYYSSFITNDIITSLSVKC